MSTVPIDHFHQLFPDYGEPKLPISIYIRLLDAMGNDAAFNLLRDYEHGIISMSDITCHLVACGDD